MRNPLGTLVAQFRRAGITWLVAALSVIAAPATGSAQNLVDVLSPQDFTRKVGTSVPVTIAFTACNPSDRFQIICYNGGASGERARAQFAQVYLNGLEVVRREDWADNAPQVIRDVRLSSNNSLRVVLAGEPGSEVTLRVVRIVDALTPAPTIELTSPREGAFTRDSLVAFAGRVSGQAPLALSLNGKVLLVHEDGSFQGSARLTREGDNLLQFSVVGAGCSETDSVRLVVRDTQSPVIALLTRANGERTGQPTFTIRGTLHDQSAMSFAVNGDPVQVGPTGSFQASVPLAAGSNELVFVATDAAGNSTIAAHTVVRTTADGPLPPEPVSVAPPADPTGTVPFVDQVNFLWTGTPRIQTGVNPAIMDPSRVAVMRGRVTMRNGDPLGGVRINLLGHPEFGETRSRADGAFDLAVNGGGTFTLCYEKLAYLSAQRIVRTGWRGFVVVDDVSLVGLDPHVTTVDFTDPVRVARGSMVLDSAGERRATVMFKAGTNAELVMPDGSTQPLTSLHFRATEFTVGDRGPESMPATLPPSSAYTYAVELSVDEAQAAGAAGVRFDRPVPSYVENYLGFPVGTPVPFGYYDRQLGSWVPQPDGRVIKVLSIDAGVASIDADGNGLPDPADSLARLGMDAPELAALAGLYSPGQSLWRVNTTHFSPADYNWPVVPFDAKSPDQSPNGDDPLLPQCEAAGNSFIECQSQALREQIPVAGTPFTLNYSSAREPGRAAARTLDVALYSGTPPASLISINVKATVAGRAILDTTLSRSANPLLEVIWDGRDAYGRILAGEQHGTVKVTYTYPVYRGQAGVNGQSFNQACPGPICTAVGSLSVPAKFSRTFDVALGNLVTPESQVGGWSLDVFHQYDAPGGVLYRGDGTRISQGQVLGPVLQAVSPDYTQPGIAVGPDGSLYSAIALNFNVFTTDEQILKRTTAGQVTVVAGVLGNVGSPADGIPASGAKVLVPESMQLAPNGDLYFVDQGTNRFRRVDSQGIINSVAGVAGPLGAVGPDPADGVRARDAKFGRLSAAIGPDGDMYLAAEIFHRIFRVGPDGILHAIAGTGVAGDDGDGAGALQARIHAPQGIRVANDGYVYFISGLNGNAIRRVSPSGMISTVVTDPSLAFKDLSFDANGGLFARSFGGIWEIASDGSRRLVAGTPSSNIGTVQPSPDNTPAVGAPIFGRGITFTPEGELVFGDVYGMKKLVVVAPEFSLSGVGVPSADGTEIYSFDSGGRPIRTLDALTGAARYRFEYDGSNRLTQVIDFDGNTTTIERDGAGAPTAIVGPYGQRTTLSVNPDGYLASFSDALNETYRFTYTHDGLLTGLQDPRGNAKVFEYDPSGRVIRDENAEHGLQLLTRTVQNGQTTVTRSTALGRRTSYMSQDLGGGAHVLEVTDPAGLVSRSFEDGAGLTVTRTPDGVVDSTYLAPDPRFGMQAPFVKRAARVYPSGSKSLSVTARSVSADPTRWLGIGLLIDSTAVNGRTYRNRWTARLLESRSSTPTGLTRVVVTDSMGRAFEVRAPGVEPIRYAYDANGRLVERRDGARLWLFSYDASGRLHSITDPILRVSTRAYDAVGRLTVQGFPDGSQVAMRYDANGNLLGLTPPDRPEHAFAFDRANRNTSYVPPFVPGAGGQASYVSNLDGSPISSTYSDGLSTSFGYDGAGRLASLAAGQTNTGYGFDPSSGRLTSITSNTGYNLAFQYDGSRATRWQSTGPLPGQVTLTYDSDGLPATETVTGGQGVSYAYNNDKALTAVGALQMTLDPTTGFVIGTRLGVVTTGYSYDSHGSIASILAKSNGVEVLSRVLVRDSLGRIVRLRQRLQAGPEQTTDYDYDIGGRLRSVREGGVTVRTYSYDPDGNRILLAGSLPSDTTGYTVDAQDRRLRAGSRGFVFDSRGRQLARIDGSDTTHYEYDLRGALLAVRTASGPVITYKVDGAGRRTARYVDGQFDRGWQYGPSSQLLAETNNAGGVLKQFNYAPGAMTPGYMVQGGVSYRIIGDERDSPWLVVNASTGSVALVRGYDEFGNVTANSAPAFLPFGFSGGLADPTSQLVRFGVRDYDPSSGRWTSRDPIRFAGGDANLYAYAGGDPVDYTDPTGLDPAGPSLSDELNLLANIHHLRNILNKEEQSTDPDVLKAKGWEELMGWRAREHTHAPGELNRKFISPDGRSEMVLSPVGMMCGPDKETYEVDRSLLNEGTYNFFDPRYALGIPHLIVDWLPYKLWGN